MMHLQITCGTNSCGSLAVNRIQDSDNAKLKKNFKKIKEKQVEFYIDTNKRKLPILLSVTK